MRLINDGAAAVHLKGFLWRLRRCGWSLGAASLALLILGVLPTAQIRLGAATLQGLVGSYITPPPPTSLVATAGDHQVLLTWTSATGATGYNVYRSTTSGSGYVLMNASPVPANAFLDNSASDGGNAPSNGTTYYYVVTALDGTAESAWSSEVSAVPIVQDPYWTVTRPSNLQVPSPDINSNSSSFGLSNATSLSASASVFGSLTSQVTEQTEVNYPQDSWTFTWTGSSWPTLYVINDLQRQMYTATVTQGTGSATIENTGGSTLVSVSYPTSDTALISGPGSTTSYDTSDLTCVVQTTASATHMKGPQVADGATTGTAVGWSEMVNDSTRVQTAYTQQWFQSHFSSPQDIVLTFSVSAADVTAHTELSNSTSRGRATTQVSVSKVFDGS